MNLVHKDISLELDSISPANYSTNFSPSENYSINYKSEKVGTLRFRIGQNKQLLFYAGQVGYEIEEAFRGNRYATKAMLAILPHCFKYFPSIFITCNEDNIASIKTIEALPHEFLGVVLIPRNNIMYAEGDRTKRRYRLLNVP